MVNLELKKKKDKYELNLYHSKGSKNSTAAVTKELGYRNIIDKDPKKIAQILIDLMFEGFPIKKAINIFNDRIRDRDWLGL